MEPILVHRDTPQLPMRSSADRPQSVFYSSIISVVMLLLIIGIVWGSLSWLQSASQRAITLGYPKPQIRLNPLASSTVRLNRDVAFSSRWAGRDLSYYWNFGDQSSDTSGPAVSHSYQSNGSYTVSVTVTDPAGGSSSDSMNIQVMPPPPVASFDMRLSGGYSYVYAAFDASNSAADASTSINGYYWDFGDGNRDTTSSPLEYHYYYYSGTYMITLTVVDALGQNSNTYTQSINI